MLTSFRQGGRDFPTTRWSLIFAARRREEPSARHALATLCEVYWRPAYAYVRRLGCTADEAQDLVQGFFTHVLEKPMWQSVDPERGRFRSLLRVSLAHFLSNERARQRAAKRGASMLVRLGNLQSAEAWCRLEPLQHNTPEQVYDRRWALLLLDRVMSLLQAEFVRPGKAALFEALQPHLTGDPDAAAYDHLAATLSMTEGAVRVAVHRLRRRYTALLRDEIGRTVATPDAIDDEIRYLRTVIGGGRS